MFNYSHKTVLITGASGGLGRELCFEFARRQAQLAICGRSEEKLQILSKEISGIGGKVIYRALDVSSIEKARDFVSCVLREFGSIDCLVNNAGIATSISSLEINEAIVKKEAEVNYFGPVYFMQEIIPFMLKQGRGQIINISSIAAFRPLPYLASYSASKAALSAFGDSLRSECLGRNIDIINVYLGQVDTGFGGRDKGKGMNPEKAAKKIISAASKRKAIVHTHIEGRFLFLLNAFFPLLADRLLYQAKVKNIDRGRL